MVYKVRLLCHKSTASYDIGYLTWWRHQMETFSTLLAICAENSPVPGEFPAQRPVTRSFDVFFDLRPNKRLGKQSWSWWFETLSPSLWRHCKDLGRYRRIYIYATIIGSDSGITTFYTTCAIGTSNSLVRARYEVFLMRLHVTSWQRHSLQRRHNGRASVSNHQPHDCLLNRLFRRRSKKTSKLRVTGLCAGNSPGPVNSPNNWPVTWKCFHLMKSLCFRMAHCVRWIPISTV